MLWHSMADTVLSGGAHESDARQQHRQPGVQVALAQALGGPGIEQLQDRARQEQQPRQQRQPRRCPCLPPSTTRKFRAKF